MSAQRYQAAGVNGAAQRLKETLLSRLRELLPEAWVLGEVVRQEEGMERVGIL